MPFPLTRWSAVALASAALCACGGGSATLPALPTASALQGECEALAGARFAEAPLANTTLTSATVAPGTVINGVALPAHCVVQGRMDPRTGVDGKSYHTGFEMRLPKPDSVPSPAPAANDGR